MIARDVFGVIIGGILGTLAAGLLVAFGAGSFTDFATNWVYYVLAILIAVLLPVLFRATGRFSAFILGVLLLTLIASTIAIIFFGASSWPAMLALGAVYALVATTVFAGLTGARSAA